MIDCEKIYKKHGTGQVEQNDGEAEAGRRAERGGTEANFGVSGIPVGFARPCVALLTKLLSCGRLGHKRQRFGFFRSLQIYGKIPRACCYPILLKSPAS